MSNRDRKSKRQQLRFAVKEVPSENSELERGLEILARLLLDRWEARHMEEESDMEEGS